MEATRGFVIEANLLNVLAGLVVPLLVAVVTKRVASSATKAWVNAGLSIIGGVLAAAAQHGGLVTHEAVTSALITWVTSITSYHGLWRPTGAAPALANATAGVGVGGPPPGTVPPPPPPGAGHGE